MFNAVIRGWIAYYGVFYRSALNPIWRHLNRKLVLWAARKYKHFRGHRQRAEDWLLGVAPAILIMENIFKSMCYKLNFQVCF